MRTRYELAKNKEEGKEEISFVDCPHIILNILPFFLLSNYKITLLISFLFLKVLDL